MAKNRGKDTITVMNPPPSPPPAPPGKPSLEQIVAQTEAAIATGQVERARQQLTWAWQVYGGVPALQQLAARLLAPPGTAGSGSAPGPAAPVPAAPLSPASMPTAVMPALRSAPVPAAPVPAAPVPAAPVPGASMSITEMPTAPMPPGELPTRPLPPPAPPLPGVAAPSGAAPRAIDPELPTAPLPPSPAAAPPPPPPGPSPAHVEAWIREAQQLVRAANYDGALTLLGQALQVAPQDENLQRHHQLTEKAAQRPRAAVEREQAIERSSREIGALLHAGELGDARQARRDALLEHGRHPAFEELQGRLEARLQGQRKIEAEALLADARFALEKGDLQQAVAAADAAISLFPDPAAAENVEAMDLRRRAQGQLNQLGREKMQREQLEAAVRDVERLLGGRELQPATTRLGQAVQRLGHHPVFDELQKKIDAAKADQQFQLRNDWVERRARELEALIQESVRASLAGDFQRAVEKLEAAKKLEPEHPELESKLEIARGLFDKQRVEQRKAAELSQVIDDLRGHLDALALDRAEHLLQRASGRFPEAADRFAPLRQRLSHLREAENADILPSPEDLPRLNRQTEVALAERQRALAAAYSWGQACSYPLRGAGPALVVFFTAALLALDLGAVYQPLLGPLRTVAPLLLFFFTLPLLSATLEGGNQPRWTDLKMKGRDVLVGFLGVLLPSFLALPLLLFVATRGNHHLLDAGSGPLGFLALAALAWPIFPPLLPLLGITAAFGARHLPRLGRHLRFLGSDHGTPWRVVALTLTLFLLAFLARLALGSAIPWLGLPLAALFAAYALVGLPHWIGVAVRRRRIELARLYS